MILLSHKLTRPFKFPHHHHHPNPDDAVSSPLRSFRSNISDLIAQTFSEPDPGPRKCFELINLTNRAFAEIAIKLDHPMTRWGRKLSDEYLDFTIIFLDMLNLINSSLSHLSHAKLSILHVLNVFDSSPSSTSADHLKKITGKRIHLSTNLNLGRSIMIDDQPCSDKDHVVLRALAVSKRIELLAIGFVVSCLCGGSEPYVELRKHVRGSDGGDDCLIKEVDSRLCKEVMEMEEVKGVNVAIERFLALGDVERLRKRLEEMESSIRWIDNRANNLFSEVLGARNKLIDNIRFTLHD